jgi:hypothetical protein
MAELKHLEMRCAKFDQRAAFGSTLKAILRGDFFQIQETFVG